MIAAYRHRYRLNGSSSKPSPRDTDLKRRVAEHMVSTLNASPGPFKAEVCPVTGGRVSFRVWPEALLGKQGIAVPFTHRERIKQFAASVARRANSRLADESPQPEGDNSFRFEIA